MQQLITLSCSPEQYAEQGLEETVGRPALCPNRQRGGTLEAHAYYGRWVSALQQAGRLHPFSGWLSLWRVAAMAKPPLGVLGAKGLEPRINSGFQRLTRARPYPA
jgi:hypothetical protein